MRAGCGERFPAPRPRQTRPENDEAPPRPRGFRGAEFKNQSRAGGLKSPSPRVPPVIKGSTRRGRVWGALWMRCPHGSLWDAAMGFFLLIPITGQPCIPSCKAASVAVRRYPGGEAEHQPSPSLPPAQTCHALPTTSDGFDEKQVPVPTGGISSAAKGERRSPHHTLWWASSFGPYEQLRSSPSTLRLAFTKHFFF